MYANNIFYTMRKLASFLITAQLIIHFTLRTLINKYVTHTTKGELYTCFVDIKMAFDSIWHDGLLYKLMKYKIGGKCYDLIKTLRSKNKMLHQT